MLDSMVREFLSTTSYLAIFAALGAACPAQADSESERKGWEFFLGVHAGVGWLDLGTVTAFPPTTNKLDETRGIIGALAGVNYRQDGWIFGFEADTGFATDRDISGLFCSTRGGSCEAGNNYHVRARVGREVLPGIDLFAAGGLALLRVKAFQFPGTAKKTIAGFSVGGGAEFSMPGSGGRGNPVLRVEALYDNYGNKSVGNLYVVRNFEDFTLRAAAIFPF